jgi:superfamily I DNA/RNA helicase
MNAPLNHTAITHKWSPQQAAFIEWAVTGTGSCVLEAVAGSGKTTTILAAAERMRGSSAILAYNKKIAEEIKGKLAVRGVDWRKVEAGTVHSFGFRAFRKAFPDVKIENAKVAGIIEDYCALGLISPEAAPYSGAIATIVGLAKQRALGILARIDDANEYYDIIDHFDVLANEEDYPDDDLVNSIVSISIRVLKASNARTDIIDFDDMVYLPLIHRVRFWQFDNVFVDEAQDTNPARRAIVRALVKKGGRVIAVGDRHQAIYGFTGADANSLDLIAKDFNAQRLPLTVTYRCPKAVVDFAQQWVGHITAHESAPDGKVSSISYEALLSLVDLDAKSAILCRNTKPLVACAFALIRNKIACRVEGRDIGNGLKNLATKWSRVKTLSGLSSKLDDYFEREKTKLLAKKAEAKLQEVEDRVETLKIIIDECRRSGKDAVSDATNAIDSIFGDGVTDVLTLSTIHKSKGREWQRVFWLDRKGTIPSKWARQNWQVEQEFNLAYVAATRAQVELIEVSEPKQSVGENSLSRQKIAAE